MPVRVRNTMPPIKLKSPITFIGAFTAFHLVHVAFLSPLLPFLDTCSTFFDEDSCTDVDKWGLAWNGVAVTFALGILMLLAFQARKNENKLRRLCVYVNYALFLQLGALIFMGSTDTGGGMSPFPFRVNVCATLALLSVGSFMLRSGPLAHAKANPYRPTTPSGGALMLHLIAYNMYALLCIFRGLRP